VSANRAISIRALTLIALVLLALAPAGRAGAQADAWRDAVVLEDSFGWWPSIALDPLGAVHVVWSGGQERTDRFPLDVVLYRRRDREGWTVTNDVQASPGEGWTARNGITVSPDGRLHLLYRRRTMIAYSSAPIRSAWSAAAWSAPRLLAYGDPYYADITSDRQGVLHVVWNSLMTDTDYGSNEDCLSCSDIYYRRSEDGGRTWTVPVNLTRTKWGSVKPRVRVDEEDTVYVTWEEGYDWFAGSGEPQGVGLIISRDGGRVWGGPKLFGVDAGAWDDDVPHAPQEIAFGIDGLGNLVVVYHRVQNAARITDDRHVYYQVSNDDGTAWSEPAVIPGVGARTGPDTGLDSYDMASDSQGHLHLVFVGARDEDDEGTGVFHVEWDGDSWGTPEEVYHTEDYCEWPRIAVDSGDGLHLVWHERRRGEIFFAYQTRTIRVMYAERPGRPVAGATLVPTATIGPTTSPIPTPMVARTPNPTYVPSDESFTGRATADEAATTRLLIAILPVLVLVVSVLLLRGFRIRGPDQGR
jgi:hypothetical protein